MKQLVRNTTLAVLAVALIFSGCSQAPISKPSSGVASESKPVPSVTKTPALPEKSAPTEVWETISGSFTREASSQYNNATLQMKYLSNNCVMFEFNLMTGSESEDWADTLVLPFVLLVDEDDGVGHYESDPEAKNPITIDFYLSENGKQITVTHTGEIPISPDGVYNFVDEGLEVSERSATAILDHLPTAATSLNSNNGSYTIQYPDELIADWFYPVEATFDDTGVVLAKFLIAKDLSAVYRVDDDIEPILIFGSAQPMMDSDIIPLKDEEISEEPSKDEESATVLEEARPVVSVKLENGVALTMGTTGKLVAIMPWELPYTLTAESSDPSVVTVDENGTITAVATGEATISGTILIDDGQKDFSIDVSVNEVSELNGVQTDLAQ